MTDFVPGFSYPAELKYDLPTQTPPGIKQIQLRQQSTSNIPPIITPGTEIQIDIPQIDFSFLDPTSTSICVRGVYNFQVKPISPLGTLTYGANGAQNPNWAQMDVPNTSYALASFRGQDGQNPIYPPISCLAARPHAILGKGWGMFTRYSVYANTNVLTDDIQEIGVLQNYMDLLTTGRNYLGSDITQTVNDPKLAGSNFLATLPECPAGNVTTYSATTSQISLNDYATSTFYGDLTLNVNDILTQNPVLKCGYNESFGDIGSKNYMPTAYNETTGILQIPFEISLPLFGTLGSGNDKMYPLFIGPTRLSLYTAALSDYIVTPQNLLCFDTYPSVPFLSTQFNLDASSVSFTQVEFVGNYFRCDTASFQYVLGNLPVDGKMICRTLSFAFSSASVSQNTSGVVDVLIPTRRASQKMQMILCTSANLADKKYGSCCPYLGQNTCLTINGVQYPQLGVDFMSKPHDAFRQTLVTLNCSYSSLVRPAISFGNWARVLTANTYNTITPGQNGLPQFITNGGGANEGIVPQSNFMPKNVPVTTAAAYDNQFFYQLIAPTLTLETAGILGTRPTGYIVSNLISTLPFWGPSVVNTVDNISYTPLYISNDVRNPSNRYTQNQNQWVHCVDTETFGRRGFLNGISTLSGSNFYHMNITQPLPSTVTLQFFTLFDAMLLFDYTTKQVSWKI